MKEKHTCKTLAIGIICLFIAVGIQPAFAVDTKQSIVNKASEEDCGCSEVDDRQLVMLERQIDRLEMYSKLLLVLSKHHSEVLEDYEELTDMISTLNTLDLKDVICDWLWYLQDKFGTLGMEYQIRGLHYIGDGDLIRALNCFIISLMYVSIALINLAIFETVCNHVPTL